MKLRPASWITIVVGLASAVWCGFWLAVNWRIGTVGESGAVGGLGAAVIISIGAAIASVCSSETLQRGIVRAIRVGLAAAAFGLAAYVVLTTPMIELFGCGASLPVLMIILGAGLVRQTRSCSQARDPEQCVCGYRLLGGGTRCPECGQQVDHRGALSGPPS